MTRPDYTPPAFIDVPQSQWGSPPPGAIAWDAAHANAMGQAIGNSAPVSVAARNPLTGWYHVEGFGAVGDGTTNDTAAIQAAIDAASAAGGGVVLFLNKTYRAVNLVLKSAVTIRSASGHYGYDPGALRPGATIQANGSGWVIDTPATTITVAAVEGLTISGNGTAGGIRIRNASWTAVRRVHINSCPDQGLLVQDGMACVFEDILGINLVLTRSRSAPVGGIDINGTDHFLSRIESSCSFSSDLGSAVSSASLYCNAFYLKGADHFVSNLVGEFADRGMLYEAVRSRLVAIRFDTNNGHGLEITGAGGNSLWLGLSIRNCGLAANNTYDAVKADGGGNQFFGLQTIQMSSNTYRYGVNDSVNTGFSVAAKNMYSHPSLTGWATAMANVVDFLGSAVIYAPVAIRPSSGTTVDVSGTTLVQPDHSAATTVTSFTGGVSGQNLTVLGNPNVTLAVSGNIRTSTGAAKTLVGDHAYSFVFYQGRWVEVAP